MYTAIRNRIHTVPTTWWALFTVSFLLPLPAFANSYGSEYLYSLMTGFGGIFVWLGGLLLDTAIQLFVIGMGQLLTTGLGVAVDQVWAIVRDLFNIFFIFSLVWIGLRTILFPTNTGPRQALGLLIVAALLINFSLFVTKTIVDFTNVAAYQIYQQIDITGNYQQSGEAQDYFFGEGSISGAFMQMTGLVTFSDTNFLDSITADNIASSWVKVITFGFLMMIFMMITGFVFAAGALMLIKRFVALVFYMIFSPAMFLGWIMPQFASYQSKWWKGFINNAFLAPAYLFMLYLSLFVLSQLPRFGGSNGFGSAFSSESSQNGDFAIFAYFFLAVGFMVGSLEVAKMFGSTTAAAGMGFLNSTSKNVQSTVRSYGMRNTVGRGASYASSVVSYLDRIRPDEKNKSTPARIGRGLVDTAKLPLVAPFGGRRAATAAYEGTANNKFGGPRSYRDDVAWKKEGREAYFKGLQTAKGNSKFEDQKRANEKANKKARDEGIESGLKGLDNTDASKKSLVSNMKELNKNLRKLSKEEWSEKPIEFLTREEVAINISNDAMKGIADSGRFNNDDLGKIKKAQASGFKNIATDGTTRLPGNKKYKNAAAFGDERRETIFRGRKPAELPDEVFTSAEMAKFLTPAILTNKLTNDDDFSQGSLDEVRKNIEADIAAGAGAGGATGRRYRMWKKWSDGGSTYASQLGLNI